MVCVLEQKLLLTAWAYTKSYEKSIGNNMNDLDLCLEVVSGHVNHASHSPLNVSKTETEPWSKDHQ